MALTTGGYDSSISILNTLAPVTRNISNDMLQIATGVQSGSAATDPSGFAAANQFMAQASSMQVAYQNVAQSQSMLQIANGGYTAIQGILTQMNDLATRAASGQSDNTVLNAQFQSLQSQIENIAGSTNYNGAPLINGSGAIQVQTGPNNSADSQQQLLLGNASLTGLGIGRNNNKIDISNTANAQAAMGQIQNALNNVNGYLSGVGDYQNTLQSSMDNLSTGITQSNASSSVIQDTDMAQASTNLTTNQMLLKLKIAMLAQANVSKSQVLNLLTPAGNSL